MNLGKILKNILIFFSNNGLYMSFDRFLLAFESRDLSQADKYYMSVFFPKVEWWVAELLFLSLNNWSLNFLQNEFSQSSQIQKFKFSKIEKKTLL